MVQAVVFCHSALAAPSLEPSNEATEVTYPSIDTTGAPKLDSLTPSEPDAERPPSKKDWTSSIRDRVSLSVGFFSGPHLEETNVNLLIFGIDFVRPFDPSDKVHFGMMFNNTRNPMAYLARENYLRNYWKYLKSWSSILQLEIDSKQNLSAFFSINHYSAGAGLTFFTIEPVELSVNLLPLSSRGVSAEVKVSCLIF